MQPNTPTPPNIIPVNRSRKKRTALWILGIFVGIWLIIGAGFLGAWLNSQFSPATTTVGTLANDGNLTVSADEADTAEVVKKVSPSVVSIVIMNSNSSGTYSTQTQESAGTGIIISKDGYILTNKHVASDASDFQIITSDGEQYTVVKFVGEDPLNDIAFLKINGVNDLSPATLGDSGTVRVGQKVVAIGNSLGQYQNTVTSGIVSGKGRPISVATDEYSTSIESLTDLIQTDAAINPGNSGGPLLNASGQVIGINTAIVSDAQSIGFAIPINATKGLVRGVLDSGKIQKAYVGVQYLAITPEVRAEYELSEKNGALVGGAQSGSAIAKSGPAEQAGIKDGDIITKVNDKIVGEQGGLGSLTAEFLPGETIELTVVRGGKERSVRLTLGAYKAQG